MKKLFENITKISVGTWVRGILSLVSIVNMALTAFGKTPVSVEYSELYTINKPDIHIHCRRCELLEEQ